MTRITLITSFDTWNHQKSNAFDDLLAEVLHRGLLPKNIHFLRKLPVDFQLAPEQVIATMNYLQPEVIICCGMAETRKTLTIELNAKDEDRVIMTPVDIRQLMAELSVNEISDDAGQFVCN